MSDVSQFISQLQSLPQLPQVFNPWRDVDDINDVGAEAPEIRAENLRQYLGQRTETAKLLFIGEAPGFRGCKFSGIAMTSERILLGNHNQVQASAVFEGGKHRTSKPILAETGFSEPTASIAWPLLLALGLAPNEFVFWNAFPCHPFRGENRLTNRTPAPQDLELAKHILPAMLALVPDAKVVAVGKVAQRALAGLGINATAVRHPAMGGANAFREQVSVLMASV